MGYRDGGRVGAAGAGIGAPLDEPAKSGEVVDDELAPADLDNAVRLHDLEGAADDFADRANEGREVLLRNRPGDDQPFGGRDAFFPGEQVEVAGDAVLDGLQTDLLDEFSEGAETAGEVEEERGSDLRVAGHQPANGVVWNEQHLGQVERLHGRGVGPAIEDRHFPEGVAGGGEAEDLLAAVGARAEDAHAPAAHEVETARGFTFDHDEFARRVGVGTQLASELGLLLSAEGGEVRDSQNVVQRGAGNHAHEACQKAERAAIRSLARDELAHMAV